MSHSAHIARRCCRPTNNGYFLGNIIHWCRPRIYICIFFFLIFLSNRIDLSAVMNIYSKHSNVTTTILYCDYWPMDLSMFSVHICNGNLTFHHIWTPHKKIREQKIDWKSKYKSYRIIVCARYWWPYVFFVMFVFTKLLSVQSHTIQAHTIVDRPSLTRWKCAVYTQFIHVMSTTSASSRFIESKYNAVVFIYLLEWIVWQWIYALFSQLWMDLYWDRCFFCSQLWALKFWVYIGSRSKKLLKWFLL